MAAVLILGCGVNAARATEYTLSFEERDRYESRKAPGNWLLQVWVDATKAHEIDVSATGPLWNERIVIDVLDPRKVRLSFRLTCTTPAVDDPEVEIGNIRVKDARGGELALIGQWTPVRTDPWFLLQRWSYEPFPAFRDGLSLRRAYGIRTGAGSPHGEWRFEGRITPVANLQIRRLFEYAGCYQELGFYDDWKNVSFTPRHPAPGERTTITARVRNTGALDVHGARVHLLVDGQLAETKRVDVASASEAEATFDWTAAEGFHSLLVRIEAPPAIPETRLDDNWLLRTLVVGDVRHAHPYLLFDEGDVASLTVRLARGPANLRTTKLLSGREQPEGKGRSEETRAIAAAHNALLSLVEPGFRPLGPGNGPVSQSTRDRAIAFLKTVWDFPRGHFSDAPCALVHYAEAYDWVARTLTEDDNREIRRRLARAIDERVRELWSDDDPRFRKGPPRTREESFYPARHRGYNQGTYIDACAIVLGALALTGEDGAELWLHFGLNAIDEEILREMTTPNGYYREGHAYTQMAESRSGAACWMALARIGAPPFELFPGAGKIHELFLRDRMPNGWSPPLNDSRGDEPLPQLLYAPLYPDPATAAAARWDWANRNPNQRGAMVSSHYGNLSLLADRSEAAAPPAAPPPWAPTQFLGDHLVFRSDWSQDAAYFCLNTKHNPTTSASHDQVDKGSFLFYARKAYLAVDPGYGNTAGRALIGTVSNWCRGADNPYNHNAIVVDGQRPTASHRSPYVYPSSPFPENTFTTGFLDFGESVLNEWSYLDPARDREPCVVNHRRSVLFVHPSSRPADHYAIVVDTLESLTDNTHSFDLVLNGNCRRQSDLIDNPGRIDDVPLADNLTVTETGGGLEARWLVENADREDVTFHAFFAAPAPERIKATTGDGWLAYLSPVARNKYLDAKVDGVRNVQFLTILYPDLLNDADDDVVLRRIGRGAELTFADGKVDSIGIHDGQAYARIDGDTDGEIVFQQRSPAGKLEALFLARGSKAKWGENGVNASGTLEILALDFRDLKEIRGYLSVASPVDLELRLGVPIQEAYFNGKKVRLSRDSNTVHLRDVKGSGELRLMAGADRR